MYKFPRHGNKACVMTSECISQLSFVPQSPDSSVPESLIASGAVISCAVRRSSRPVAYSVANRWRTRLWAEVPLVSLQPVVEPDARAAGAICEGITQRVTVLARANAGHTGSPMGWRTVPPLLSVTARHPEASHPGGVANSGICLQPPFAAPDPCMLRLRCRPFSCSRTSESSTVEGKG